MHKIKSIDPEISVAAFRKLDWRTRAYYASRGQCRAIVINALDIEPTIAQRYVGAPSHTSDGFVMCSYVDSEGSGHLGAFVGSLADVRRNLEGLADHTLGPRKPLFTDKERAAFLAATARWRNA